MALVDKLAKFIAANPSGPVEVEDVDVDDVKKACAPPTLVVPDFVDIETAKQLDMAGPPDCLGFFKGRALVPPQPKPEPAPAQPKPDPADVAKAVDPTTTTTTT